jgi:chemotaxis protein histidine kinase CheA
VDDLHDIVKDFLVESYENLDQLDRDLVQLEQDPDSAKVLGSIFRTIHTIKGACGFLGFSKLESVAHAGENLLSKVRDREVEFWPDRSSGLFRLVDAIREILPSCCNPWRCSRARAIHRQAAPVCQAISSPLPNLRTRRNAPYGSMWNCSTGCCMG